MQFKYAGNQQNSKISRTMVFTRFPEVLFKLLLCDIFLQIFHHKHITLGNVAVGYTARSEGVRDGVCVVGHLTLHLRFLFALDWLSMRQNSIFVTLLRSFALPLIYKASLEATFLLYD